MGDNKAKGKGRSEGSKKTQFKKGNKLSPGRPKDTIYQKLIKGKVQAEFYEYMFKAWDMKLKDIENIVIDQDKSIPEQIFLRWFLNRLKDPGNSDIEMIAKLCGVNLNNMVIDNISSDGSMTPVNINANIPIDLTKEEKIDYIKAALIRNEKGD